MLNPLNVPAWDAGTKECKHSECSGKNFRGNTHLWVVNRALDLLAKSDDPIARRVVARMNKKGRMPAASNGNRVCGIPMTAFSPRISEAASALERIFTTQRGSTHGGSRRTSKLIR